ncbi:hypothetical protein LSH36_376g04007 [Paralvinella palmiformis]|uniref:TBC domain-containing protein kinase-like protein n=1 Tax=Paralvinella palmiformis TaxID=53620 RepID=A0AAD9N116_9ANNE|nr:hypothetical protein LSH36_376g04007 [Paralvinella palmiformis]
MQCLDKAELGATTLCGSSQTGDECGSNGLPLTPNGIRILGQFQKLKTIKHPRLCKYIDLVRGKHERVIIVTEHYRENLEDRLKSSNLVKLAYEALEGLAYLNKLGIVHRNLAPQNILFDEHGVSLWNDLALPDIISKIFSFLETDTSPLFQIAEQCDRMEDIKCLPSDVVHLMKQCLVTSPLRRPEPTELLELPLFKEFHETTLIPDGNSLSMFSTKLRCKLLEVPTSDDFNMEDPIDHLSERSFDEVYYLWGLAGGDLEMVLKKAGLIRSSPPITKLSKFVVEEGEMFHECRDRSILLDDTVVILPLDQLRQRLHHVDAACYYPLLETRANGDFKKNNSIHPSASSGDLTTTSKLPLVIREKDVEYQFHRIILYERLLQGYPYTKSRIVKEARVDIPPLLRAKVWAAMLDIHGDVVGIYDAIDKETPTITDRQIEVDIPRCHQYNELLSSPMGHAKFKRLLKAWVVSHPHYVYWQGLDSLCAPFLYLNFNEEAVAFACLTAFIPKYLHKFFLKDNSAIVQEYLAVFSHLISFHDPELSNHLTGIGFVPELYAIPWFLTMYAHVFPLNKIFHLWDTLLLGNSSFPLYIGVAILQQLRDQLLSFGFNECILLFSDMPQIDIYKVVQESVRLFRITPRSATYRQYAPVEKDTAPKIAPGYMDTSNGFAHLSMDGISLEDLKQERCPRISADDLIKLCELHIIGSSPGSSPSKWSRADKPPLVVIDIRPQEEYPFSKSKNTQRN